MINYITPEFIREILHVTSLFIICIILFNLIKKSEDKKNWFYNLKPNDKILVQIFSYSCECYVEAIVISPAKGKYIKAEIINKNCNECDCVKKSCWKDVTEFEKYKTKPIKK